MGAGAFKYIAKIPRAGGKFTYRYASFRPFGSRTVRRVVQRQYMSPRGDITLRSLGLQRGLGVVSFRSGMAKPRLGVRVTPSSLRRLERLMRAVRGAPNPLLS